jgi:hypothetical protein
MASNVSAPQREAAVALAAAALAPNGAAAYASLKNDLRAAVARDPFDAMVVMVLGGAFLFYLAEVGRNPKVRTYWDALVFVSTCASVGYADVFARTPAGKAVATAVMTIGPALSGAMLDLPRSEDAARGEKSELAVSAEVVALQRAIVDKLDAILTALRTPRDG